MQMQFTPNNKLASLGTVGLLFLAGIAGMVFLLPASPVHAAGPTVTLSTLASGVLTAAPSGTVGTTLVVEGFGFSAATPITITTSVGTTTVQWLNNPGSACSTTNGGISSAATPVASLVVSGCLVTTAVGNFAVEVVVPNLPGGPQSISVSDGVNTATASFTVTPKVAVTFPTGNNYGYPESAVTPSILVTGFGSGESVTVSTPMFNTASFSCTTGNTLGTGYGRCTAGAATAVAETTGGAKTITATGATSGLTASTTYTVNPWAAFYNSQLGVTSFSFLGSSPTSLLIEAHGLPAGTVAANSITIGGVATNHGSVVVGSSGAFGGAGAFLVVSPTANVPFGPASVVIAGDTFNYATGNIGFGAGTWGGVVISSIIGSTSSTGVVTTDASSYKPGGYAASTTSTAPQTSQIAFFGYGFTQPTHAVTITTPTGASFTPIRAPGNADANGAFFSTQSLGETPWSTSSAPSAAAFYAVTVTQASGPSSIISPSFGITPWIASVSSATVDYQSSDTVTVHGFGAADVVSATFGGSACGTPCQTAAAVTNGAGTTVSQQVPDIAGGAQNVVATGSVSGQSVTMTGGVTYAPFVGPTGGSGVQALSINNGGAGLVTTLRTGSSYGVHGLLANDAYQIVWNPIGGSITLGTFTSTATGGIPIPGVQFTIPSDSSGIHIVDIQNTGSYAIFGSLFGGQSVPSETPFSSTYTTGYGDLLFKNIALLQAAPSVATIGSPETLSGSGLSAGTSYVVTLSSNAATVTPNSSPALATFIATSAGSVPSGTSVTLTDTATTLETGTVEYLTVQTNAHYGVSPYSADAYAQFVLAANAKLNMTSAPAGHAVTLTAHALNGQGAVYSIIFNYVQSAFNAASYSGTTVGVIAPSTAGSGSATFNVPAGATTGTYTVQLVVSSAGTGGATAGNAVLDTPLTLTVGGVSGSCTNEGTACMGISGTPAVSKQSGNTIISASYTNNSNAPQTAFIYAVVHNALGQTVSYTTATISPAAGASQTGQLVLFGLAPGTYSVTVFVVSSSGTALSTGTTVSVTI